MSRTGTSLKAIYIQSKEREHLVFPRFSSSNQRPLDKLFHLVVVQKGRETGKEIDFESVRANLPHRQHADGEKALTPAPASSGEPPEFEGREKKMNGMLSVISSFDVA